MALAVDIGQGICLFVGICCLVAMVFPRLMPW